jgi:hypothetical protein
MTVSWKPTTADLMLSLENTELIQDDSGSTHLSADESTESKGGELATVQSTLIHVANVDLDRDMVLWGDDPVRGRAEGDDDAEQEWEEGCHDHNAYGISPCYWTYHFLGT